MAIESETTIECNPCNYSTRNEDDIDYLVFHYTGTVDDTPEGECSYFQNNDVGASAHVFVGPTSVCHSVDYADKAWAVGADEDEYKHDSCRNFNSISIEMCTKQDADGNYYIDEDTITNAIELGHRIMKAYNISIDHVLMHAGPHPDSVVVPEVKLCPEPFQRDWSLWDKFKERLANYQE